MMKYEFFTPYPNYALEPFEAASDIKAWDKLAQLLKDKIPSGRPLGFDAPAEAPRMELYGRSWFVKRSDGGNLSGSAYIGYLYTTGRKANP